jgi:hypothetical protein
LKSETCDVIGRVKVQVSGEHLASCKHLRKNGLKTVVKHVLKEIKNQNKNPNFGPAQVRDALKDRGFSADQLPPVSKVTNLLSHERNTSSTP